LKSIFVGCDLNCNIRSPTTFLFNVGVANTATQRLVREQFHLSPDVAMQSFPIGLAGNQVQRFRLLPCTFRLRYEAVVTLGEGPELTASRKEQSYRDLPPEVLPYLNPSRFCESDLLGEHARGEFGKMQQGYSRVLAICDWIHQHIQYTPGSTTSHTTACDVLIQRQGVCRDFAHLGIAFCRALGIPARYVSGYGLGVDPPDFHGFFEAFLGERWHLFDPTRLAPIDGLVRIASGLDAADVPFVTWIGSAVLTGKLVWAQPASG
jgi:transglutaminase-like putative cysteine protease